MTSLSGWPSLYGHDAKADELAGFIAIIGAVSGDADLNGADAVLGGQGQYEKRDEGESKHGVTLQDSAATSVRCGREHVRPS